ncbi:MAG: protein-L-isoaspartate(D-aspartate) O-methyltransferase [Candidatus Krumholzibacteria bacterium]|jgi:protein-L-isoaspartate(D-aspartate) O-methyltransferase|nr:protein-L-isoaspartate(D-aspartate) O-methyltransferase [Candidatus Krumholzibacteria bacterium]MDP6669550.1 protein-L-isoaspartate(D-aspartate) O-methyltransferase [Candidatus Krumholzibacteria bacterium]MDP6797770.1 protein-L-isoaspartate(D-aspartate) O-methyltransferase [Candidatus Krumholzibacteria bacterium]MDP7020886.1 protein-L-isoaspartate(D-aspartate) O-methyltransferase [Candidatus Krumholzibacteria bacterium]
MNGEYQVARNRMVQRIRDRKLASEAVLAAMREIPRHIFAESALALRAYGEDALPIGAGQTLSHPEVVAFMTESLQLQAGMKVLEVGTGSGYQAALLHLLGAEVWTVERIASLHRNALSHWSAMGLQGKIRSRVGDGYEGWIEDAPFDRILLTAAPRQIPEALLNQLADGAQLLLPLEKDGRQRLLRVRREGNRAYQEELGDCQFVPMLARTVGS